MPAISAWSDGRLGPGRGPNEILFGRVYEDAAIEAAVFPPASRIFCIASAGCTVLRLAADRDVTAVDINPAQLAYARRRAKGAPREKGAAERLMAKGRRLLPALGWTRLRVEKFLALSDPAEQVEFWRRRLNTRRFRWALDAVLSPLLLRAGYRSSLIGALPGHFGATLRRRMERCWRSHPNFANPYARALLAGGDGNDEPAWRQANPIRFVCADAATFLESCPPASFDGFALSNILDGAPAEYGDRLAAAVRRTAARESVLVRRSFAEPGPSRELNLAAEDRSPLWGVVAAVPAEEFEP